MITQLVSYCPFSIATASEVCFHNFISMKICLMFGNLSYFKQNKEVSPEMSFQRPLHPSPESLLSDDTLAYADG